MINLVIIPAQLWLGKKCYHPVWADMKRNTQENAQESFSNPESTNGDSIRHWERKQSSPQSPADRFPANSKAARHLPLNIHRLLNELTSVATWGTEEQKG